MNQTVEAAGGGALAQFVAGRTGTQRALFLAAAGMAALSFSNPAWQSLHALAWILLTVEMVRRRRWLVPGPPRWAVPWGIYAAWVLAAGLLGPDPATALQDPRKLLTHNLATVFLFAAVLRSAADYARVLAATCGMLSLQSILGLMQFVGADDHIAHRTKGTLSHHMTYSGMLLITIAMVLALLTLRRRRTDLLWWGFAGLATAALLATLTRSAWVGLALALALILAFKNPRWLAALPVALALLFLLAPELRQRTLSMWDTRGDYSNVQRLSMYPTGLRMIADHPWFGLGSRRAVRDLYTRYEGEPPAPPPVAPGGPPAPPYEPPDHLHNNLLQIAATSGVPALLAWLAALAVYAREALRLLPRRRDVDSEAQRLRRNLLLGSLAAVAAFLAMGMLEYNFGDAEVTVLLCLALSIPFALANGERTA